MTTKVTFQLARGNNKQRSKYMIQNVVKLSHMHSDEICMCFGRNYSLFKNHIFLFYL